MQGRKVKLFVYGWDGFFALFFFKVIHGVHRLNKYKKKFYKKTANLLTGKSDQDKRDLEKAGKVTFEVKHSQFYFYNYLHWGCRSDTRCITR